MAEKRVKLKSSDDEIFEVDEVVASESQVMKNTIEDTGIDAPIPLPHVSSKILAKVIEYCKYHVDKQKTSEDKPATPEDDMKAWDADFVKVDPATLFELIVAADYLNIKNLLDLTCQTVADIIEDKTPEEIGKTFNIKDDSVIRCVLTILGRLVELKSSDGVTFEVHDLVAFEMPTVKDVIEDTGIDATIPLPNVSSKLLAKVIEYCKYHVDNQKTSEDKPATPEDDIKAWDADFVKVDPATLFDLILAANYLNIKNLRGLLCGEVMNTYKGKTPEEIRKMFNIKNDVTPK